MFLAHETAKEYLTAQKKLHTSPLSVTKIWAEEHLEEKKWEYNL